MRHALVTGGAGFIGSHLVDRLLKEGWQVTVIDNFDPFYDPAIKRKNISTHFDYNTYRLFEIDIRDMEALQEKLTDDYDIIIHLAAKAGVRPSIQDPIGYQEVNVRGTQNLLEFAFQKGIKQFIFASLKINIGLLGISGLLLYTTAGILSYIGTIYVMDKFLGYGLQPLIKEYLSKVRGV